MSHEIRTPINTIIGLNEMILREDISDEVAQDAKNIQSASRLLLSLINDILDMSKIESGRMELVPVVYDLGDMLSELVGMMWIKAQEKGLDFHIDIDPGIPSKLTGDEMRIKQVMVNLLTNAVKYTRQGSIWLRIGGTTEGIMLHMHVEVEDTGIGIKEEDLPGLFDVYKRLEMKENYHVEGTGLGLSIANQFLSLMGSELKVESEYGKGSKFYFDLDQEIVDVTPLGEEFNPTLADVMAEHHSGGTFVAPAAKILVVDDNKMNRQVVRSLLKATQIQIMEASGGEESVEMAKKHIYNIIYKCFSQIFINIFVYTFQLYFI
jgi:K+-sensing histidine kinase KdpD